MSGPDRANQAEARQTEGGLLFCPAAPPSGQRQETAGYGAGSGLEAADRVLLTAPAKVNLSLAITGTREDGYHTLDTLMSSVSLADELLVSWYDSVAGLPEGQQEEGRLQLLPGLTMGISGLRDVARLRLNTVSKAALILTAAFGEELKQQVRGHMQIDLVKRIPSQAGLGGGSTDAAALLRYLLTRWARLLPDHGEDYWIELSAAVGADVPFCMTGGLARCTGIGDVIEQLPYPGSWPIVLVKPAIGSSTPSAFARYDALQGTTRQDEAVGSVKVDQAGRQRDLVELIGQLGRLDSARQTEACALMREMNGLRGNDFEALIAPDCPEVARILDVLGDVWPCAVTGMSGSGTACFALLPGAAETAELRRLKAGLDDALGEHRWRGWSASLSGTN